MTITLNLAGDFVILNYSPKFRKIGLYDPQWKCWHPIYVRRNPIQLRCGRFLYKKDLVLAIKHKLGLIP